MYMDLQWRRLGGTDLNNAFGWILLAVAAALIVVGIKGNQNQLFPWLPVAPGGNTGVGTGPGQTVSNVPTSGNVPGAVNQPSKCGTDPHKCIGFASPFTGVDSSGCCPDGYAKVGVGGLGILPGVFVCMNQYNVAC